MIRFSHPAIVTLERVRVTEPKRRLPRMLWTFEVMGEDLYGCLVIAQPKGIPLSARTRRRITLLVACAGRAIVFGLLDREPRRRLPESFYGRRVEPGARQDQPLQSSEGARGASDRGHTAAHLQVEARRSAGNSSRCARSSSRMHDRPLRSRTSNFFNGLSAGSPMPVTALPASRRRFKLTSSLRYSRPASPTCVRLRLSFSSCVRPEMWRRPALLTLDSCIAKSRDSAGPRRT